jgi:hypothetical protein
VQLLQLGPRGVDRRLLGGVGGVGVGVGLVERRLARVDGVDRVAKVALVVGGGRHLLRPGDVGLGGVGPGLARRLLRLLELALLLQVGRLGVGLAAQRAEARLDGGGALLRGAGRRAVERRDLGGDLLQLGDRRLVGGELAVPRVELVQLRRGGRERVDLLVARQILLRLRDPLLEARRLVVEARVEQVQLALALARAAQVLLALLLGLEQLRPQVVDLLRRQAARRHERRAVVRRQHHLDRVEERLAAELLRRLLGLLLGQVLVVLAELARDLLLGLAKLLVVEPDDLALDPRAQLAGALVVLVAQLLHLALKVDELADAAARLLALALRREHVVVLHDVRDHRALVRLGGVDEVLDVEQLRNAELLLGHLERQQAVLARRALLALLVVEQVGPVPVDERAERQAVAPAGVEVLDAWRVDVAVALGLLLAPEQQRLLGRELLLADVGDLVLLDDGPDHAENEREVAVDDVLGLNGDELDALGLEELHAQIDVLDLLDLELRRLVVLARPVVLGRDDLRERVVGAWLTSTHPPIVPRET